MKYIPAHTSNYTIGRTRKIDHIVIHYTGNDGDTAAGNGNYFSGAGRSASAHYFVDKNEVVQSVKDCDTAWHAGNWQMNCRSIGVELCSHKDANGRYYFDEATIRNAQTLTKALMSQYNIDSAHVIRHYDVTKKVCPEPFVRDTRQWAAFKDCLTEPTKSDGGQTMAVNKEPSAWAKADCEWAAKKGIFKGDGNGDYRWHDPITREEIAAVLHRLSGEK